MLNILDFGAIGDGKLMNTRAFAAANRQPGRWLIPSPHPQVGTGYIDYVVA